MSLNIQSKMHRRWTEYLGDTSECKIKCVSIWNKLLSLHKKENHPSLWGPSLPPEKLALILQPYLEVIFYQKIQSSLLNFRGGWGEKNHSVPRNIYTLSILNCFVAFQLSLARIYLFTGIHGDIRMNVRIKILGRRHWHRSDALIVNFEQLSHIVLVFLLITLNM